MEILFIYMLPILIDVLGAFGIWCTEPEGKMGIVLTFLMMFIPIFNWIPAIVYLIVTVYMILDASPTFKKCKNFWKFLFGENSIY